MPHNNAQIIRNSDVFTPTIFINNMKSHEQFDKDFPAEERARGFMVSCKGVVFYWDAQKKEFCTELIAPEI